MTRRNYSCVYAPKPGKISSLSFLPCHCLLLVNVASACLEVSSRSDGCALFVRSSKLKILSVETITYALTSKLITSCPIQPRSYIPTLLGIRPQNQVAIIAVCEVVDPSLFSSSSFVSSSISSLASFHSHNYTCNPCVIVSTTHLKAAKNAVGELYRLSEAQQLLAAIEKVWTIH